MNVLIVEDEASFRLIVGDLLKESGHKVFTAEDGEEGMQAILRERIDIVISDLHMHRMDGIKFLKSARALPGFRSLPFLIVSAYEDEGTLKTINSYRFTSFLRKGGSMQELESRLEELWNDSREAVAADPPPPPQPAPVPVPAHPPVLRTPKSPDECLVLVVDDDDTLRKMLYDSLTNAGYAVVAAADGTEAIEVLGHHTFDLVLTDIVMPAVSGFEVLKFVQERSPSTRVIMITAYADLKLAVEAKKLGAHDFVAKPFMPKDLLNTIKHVLAG